MGGSLQPRMMDVAAAGQSASSQDRGPGRRGRAICPDLQGIQVLSLAGGRPLGQEGSLAALHDPWPAAGPRSQELIVDPATRALLQEAGGAAKLGRRRPPGQGSQQGTVVNYTATAGGIGWTGR